MINRVAIILLLVIIASCHKPDNPIVKPPPPPPIDTTCVSVFSALSTENFSYINSAGQSEGYYFKSVSSDSLIYFKFDTLYSGYYDNFTSKINDTCFYYESAGLTFRSSNYALLVINYLISPNFIEKSNFGIDIGRFSSNTCYSRHTLTIPKAPDMASAQLGSKTFYDLYHSTTNQFDCCPELYYNKQYGVVAFSWYGNWWVLETDSL